jgi:hypothetical protein
LVAGAASVRVGARKRRVDTGIDLVAGVTYEFRADGRWLDLVIRSGPEGYPTPWWSLLQRLVEEWRPLQTANWMTLGGEVRTGDGDVLRFGIGSRVRRQVPAGRLWCFANDAYGWYWNNFGSVSLTVEAIESPSPSP